MQKKNKIKNVVHHFINITLNFDSGIMTYNEMEYCNLGNAVTEEMLTGSPMHQFCERIQHPNPNPKQSERVSFCRYP